jgi:hypothetical protein
MRVDADAARCRPSLGVNILVAEGSIGPRPAGTHHQRLQIIPARGYPSSFIEEAFGGLLSTGLWNSDHIQRHLSIRANGAEYLPYRDRILGYFRSKKR